MQLLGRIPLTHVGFAGSSPRTRLLKVLGQAQTLDCILDFGNSRSFYKLLQLAFDAYDVFWATKSDSHAYSHAKESPMVMLIPLGLLGLGAILSGMIWYSSFFGKDYQVANFFGIESEYQQTLPKKRKT